MRRIALSGLSLALLGVFVVVPPSVGATSYSTITATKTYVGSNLLLYFPCKNGRGPSADADLNGGCFLLPIEHPGTLVSIGIGVEDATGKPVALRYELISWDCYPGIGCGWGQNGQGGWCSGSQTFDFNPSNSATHLEITLGSSFTGCPTQNVGATGTMTVTFTYQSP